MRRLPLDRLSCFIALGLSGLTPVLSLSAASAQLPSSQMSNCQPPANNEYLLLTVTPNADAQAKVYAVLPASFKPIACNYIGETVLRIGGFATQEAADTWASYIAQQAGTSTFVARPPAPGQASTLPPLPPTPVTPGPAINLPGGSSPIPQPIQPQPIQPSVPTPTGDSTTGGYNPQALGNGYAVLVNYSNRPEIATSVRSATNQDLGLVAYGQRPYLLATFTADAAAANELLQRLTDKGFAAMVVDGRRVILLKSGIR
jgi:hypothetical protein